MLSRRTHKYEFRNPVKSRSPKDLREASVKMPVKEESGSRESE